MAPPLLRRDVVHRQLERLHDHLRSLEPHGVQTGAGQRLAPETLTFVRRAVRGVLDHEPEPGGDYYSRSPVVSLAQSALHEHLEAKRAAGEVEHDDERMGDPFTKADVAGWVADVALSLVGRWLHGSHPFCDAPARAELPARARLVVFGDWGTGRRGAEMVAGQARRLADEADAPVHLVHLGDTYYSGTEREARRNVLDAWPVGPDRAAAVGSWALNGNHDMYSGGHGLFEATLGDPRFAAQQVDGRPTSWFVLRSPGWNVVALDTSWKHPLLEVHGGRPYFEGVLGHLNGSQADVLAACARDRSRRLLVLSHHQLFSAYDDDHAIFGGGQIETPLAQRLAPVLAEREVDAWFWGHEHDCLAYERFGGVAAARAIGHGGVPVVVRDTPATPIDGLPDFVVGPVAEASSSAALRALRWEYRDHRIGEDGAHWAKHGLAVLDLDGSELRVQYVDDEGVEWLRESL
jgi:hypothetical protein